MVKEAVDASIDHLLPWMPWARGEPTSIDEKMQLLRTFRGSFDRDENYIYGVFPPDESRLLGGTGLHPRSGPMSLEIGYWIRADALGRGYATELTAALTRVAFAVCGAERVDVQVEPENPRSLKVPRKLGFTEEATLRHRLDPHSDDGPRRDAVLFTMLREELDASPCAAQGYVAYDAAGNRLP